MEGTWSAEALAERLRATSRPGESGDEDSGDLDVGQRPFHHARHQLPSLPRIEVLPIHKSFKVIPGVHKAGSIVLRRGVEKIGSIPRGPAAGIIARKKHASL